MNGIHIYVIFVTNKCSRTYINLYDEQMLKPLGTGYKWGF
jgi:hypothetical protein